MLIKYHTGETLSKVIILLLINIYTHYGGTFYKYTNNPNYCMYNIEDQANHIYGIFDREYLYAYYEP